MNKPNYPELQLTMRDDSPNYMKRHIIPASQLDFYNNPDSYTEENERLQAQIGAETMRQEFEYIINQFNNTVR